MKLTILNQGINVFSKLEESLIIWIEAFLVDRKAQNLSAGTVEFYRKKLKLFSQYCERQAIQNISEVTSNDIRLYMLFLEERGHNHEGCMPVIGR